METFEEIKNIVETVLGEPKRSYSGSGGWYEYNCPSCADENCGAPDGKYNLALNYTGRFVLVGDVAGVGRFQGF